jgi:hypothetical protein
VLAVADPGRGVARDSRTSEASGQVFMTSSSQARVTVCAGRPSIVSATVLMPDASEPLTS